MNYPYIDANQIHSFLKYFKQGYLKHDGNIVLDLTHPLYISTEGIKTVEELEAVMLKVVADAVGEIGGTYYKDANNLLDSFNSYFETNLTRKDMGIISKTVTLLIRSKRVEFIEAGLPMHQIRKPCIRCKYFWFKATIEEEE